jgi:BirA family biotin operon repressor/biotin-[acetyl-CoA-carboxylase] ligase
MSETSTLFDPGLLRQGLQRHHSGLELHYLPTCASTNQECLQLKRHGSVVISDRQTAGRGRRGRDWYSPYKRNLYCSLGIDKVLPASSLGLVSLLVGVGLADTLHAEGFDDVGLKWPNDLLRDGRKLGGILIETTVRQAGGFYLTVGIGLNLQLQDHDLERIGQPAAGLWSAIPSRRQASELVARLISGVFGEVERFEPTQGDALLQRFAGFDVLVGHQVTVLSAHDEQHGHYAGVEPDGRLRIETDHGLQTFVAADVSLRSSSHAAG